MRPATATVEQNFGRAGFRWPRPARLGMYAHACTVALQRVRQCVGQRLRAAVAETVAGEAEIDVELRHLIAR